jgi:hypothetical protein
VHFTWHGPTRNRDRVRKEPTSPPSQWHAPLLGLAHRTPVMGRPSAQASCQHPGPLVPLAQALTWPQAKQQVPVRAKNNTGAPSLSMCIATEKGYLEIWHS